MADLAKGRIVAGISSYGLRWLTLGMDAKHDSGTTTSPRAAVVILSISRGEAGLSLQLARKLAESLGGSPADQPSCRMRIRSRGSGENMRLLPTSADARSWADTAVLLWLLTDHAESR